MHVLYRRICKAQRISSQLHRINKYKLKEDDVVGNFAQLSREIIIGNWNFADISI